jgi:hypothetical protein
MHSSQETAMTAKPRRPIRRAGRTFIATLFLGAALVAPSAALATQPAPDHMVTICHRTDSDTNPYVEETVDVASSGHLQGGHDTKHEGPIWDASLKSQKIEWGDIIPPYTYGDFSYPGQNWTDEGQAILRADCVIETPSESVPVETESVPVETESVPVETPEGSVESETGTPQEGLTPPPTDTLGEGDQTSDPTTVLLLLLALALGVGLSADHARRGARARR